MYKAAVMAALLLAISSQKHRTISLCTSQSLFIAVFTDRHSDQTQFQVLHLTFHLLPLKLIQNETKSPHSDCPPPLSIISSNILPSPGKLENHLLRLSRQQPSRRRHCIQLRPWLHSRWRRLSQRSSHHGRSLQRL